MSLKNLFMNGNTHYVVMFLLFMKGGSFYIPQTKKEGMNMKFTIKREILLEALNKVSKAISTKNLIPVLAGIKFELKKKKIKDCTFYRARILDLSLHLCLRKIPYFFQTFYFYLSVYCFELYIFIAVS